MKRIKVDNPGNLPVIEWAELSKVYESNSLKEKKSRKIESLKQSILTLGFRIPFFIWKEGNYIIDGAGRLQALAMLQYEGYEIPPLPYVQISAKNKKEAKQVTIAASSQYGKTTKESLVEFIGIDVEEFDLGFAELGIEIEEIDWKPQGEKPEKEKREKGKSVIMHTCPECGHEFN